MSHWMHTQASHMGIVHQSICASSWINDDFTFHAQVPKPTKVAAAKRVGSGPAGDKFNHHLLAFFNLPAILRMGKNQPGRDRRRSCPIRINVGEKTMSVVNGQDMQLHGSPVFYVDGRRIEMIFLGGNMDYRGSDRGLRGGGALPRPWLSWSWARGGWCGGNWR